jgi:twitching motility protein PilT
MTALLDMRLTDILYAAQRQGASDVHFIPGMRAALRVDGEFSLMAGAPFGIEEISTIAATLFSAEQLENIRAGEDVSTTWTDDERLTIRAHGLRTCEGVTLAVRLLHRRIPTLDELHIPAAVAGLTRSQRGLIVFGGPTGSGKSTSLAAFVHEMNRTSARRVMTIEDPIEYRHHSDRSIITQREIGTHAKSYARALTGALRSDPDVIVIGEMRDSETIRAALTAAETGHLVLTTLHTADAVQTIDRIVDAFGDNERGAIRGQLATALHAVVSQRLVPALHGGRRPVVEVMIATDGIRAMIRDGRTHLIKNAISTARAQGMQTMEQHTAELTRSGEL